MFDRVFCSGPWLHMRINPTGEFGPCRWSSHRDEQYNIKTHSVKEYFQKRMAPLRRSVLEGDRLEMCSQCYQMEEHDKVSGRQRQLLKTGIMTDHFVPSLQSSTFRSAFQYSQNNDGDTDLLPIDWQIDLGNYCNSACVMCSPRYSSKLGAEFKKIGLIDDTARWNSSWSDNDTLLEKFCHDLASGPTPAYLHFLGGETLIIPAFKKILSELAEAKMTAPAVGFTTNLTVWPQDTIDQLLKFDRLNIGLSIESLHDINHYVRWPGRQEIILQNLEKWIDLADRHGHLVQLRLTPSALTILHVADLYQYAWDRNIGVETCNFITNPRYLGLKVLPNDLRSIAISRLEKFLDGKPIEYRQVVNTRNPSMINQQVIQDARSYINFLRSSEYDHEGAHELVQYIRQLERSRGNNILDYLPEYEKFLRSHGY